MKYIRKKINLENFTVRSIPKSVLTTDSEGKTVIDTSNPNYYYGTIPEYKVNDKGNFILNSSGQKILNTINVDLFLTSNYDDMGLFTDTPYTPSNQILTNKPIGFNSFQYGRLAGAPVNFYYSPPNTVTGYTDDSLLKQVKSYRKINNQDIYVPNLNTSDNPKKTFNGVLEESIEKTKYKIGANTNNIQNTGVEYSTFKNKYSQSKDEYGKNITYNTTTFKVTNSGWNNFNTSLNATMKKEEYLGVVFKPEVESVVFINRGIADIFERHAILSEIKTTNDIDTNRGGFIRI